jgi:hypothetical protein
MSAPNKDKKRSFDIGTHYWNDLWSRFSDMGLHSESLDLISTIAERHILYMLERKYQDPPYSFQVLDTDDKSIQSISYRIFDPTFEMNDGYPVYMMRGTLMGEYLIIEYHQEEE